MKQNQRRFSQAQLLQVFNMRINIVTFQEGETVCSTSQNTLPKKFFLAYHLVALVSHGEDLGSGKISGFGYQNARMRSLALPFGSCVNYSEPQSPRL